uniref:ribonuclease P n=1 Tax=Pseudo-nitzschia australis TaxID=44445 RepID=A0A6U9X7K5_9STRA
MDGRHRFLPLLRRWATFGPIRTAKNDFLAVSSIQQSILSPRPIDESLYRREQCRYYKTSDDDDDESRDMQEQKTAFLRALEGNKNRNRNAGSLRNTATTKNKPNDKMKRVPNYRNHNHNSIYSRRTNNRNNFRTTTATSSGTSKKLTLDEFFANLEGTQTEESNSNFGSTKTSRTRIIRKGGGQGQQRKLGHQHSNNRRKSMPTKRETTAADMGSFFDDVDALMERKQEEKAKGGAILSMLPTENIDSPLSVPAFRSSIADIIPPRPPISRSVSTNDGTMIRNIDENFQNFTYNIDSWDQYTELLEEIMEGPKFLARLKKKKKKTVDEDDNTEKKRQIMQIVEWLRSDMPAIETHQHLPTLGAALKGENRIEEVDDNSNDNNATDENSEGMATIGMNTGRSGRFRKELTAQKERFMKEMGWTKGQYDVATGALVALGGLCAKRCMAPPLDVAWSKLKELGYPMKNKDVLHNYLYVASTFSLPRRKVTMTNNKRTNLGLFGDERIGDQDEGGAVENGSSLSILDFLDGMPNSSSNIAGDEDDGGDDGIDVSAEVALCHDFFHEATEQSIGIHVRRLVHLGKANEAERLLDATMKSDDLRLRTYAPIYQTYLDQGDVSSAFKLFVKMKEVENVLLQTETYVQLIACIAENGYFRTVAKEINGMEELPYPVKCGPELFDVLASELAEHSIEITSASAKRLYNAFQRGFKGHDLKMNLKQLHLLESLRTNDDLAQPEELIVSRVRIDESTGKCPRSGSQLRLINLDCAQKKQFQDGLLYLVSSTYQERHRNARKVDVAEKLKRFGGWLQNRDGKTPTAIIDGPNIAYYMQNFQQGTFNYHQIKFVSDALENMGENVLVVLPKKYTYDSFTIQVAGRTAKQTLSSEERDIRDDLLTKGKACVVPVGHLDDYYWMFASVSMDEEFVPPDNPEGRWPGNRPMLISNDKLRDHKMSLLEPRLFRRWFSNFLVNFTFSAFVNDECVDREIGFRTADFYSREIQGNFDQNGTVWHLPVRDWDENESMCIRIPNKKE